MHYLKYVTSNVKLLFLIKEIPPEVIASGMNCDTGVNDFELKFDFELQFRNNTFGKIWTS